MQFPLPTFAEEFERILTETDTGVRRLSRLSGISRRTLENWLYGLTRRPRHVEPILRVAATLRLPTPDTNRLLQSAGYPTLEHLINSNDPSLIKLLRDWQLPPGTLIGQKIAALSRQHNLPAAATPFLGREELREELATQCRRPDLRLITVSGLGGAGKTRLALETARSLIDWYDHGVYFVPLDNVNNTRTFWQAILEGLDIPDDGANVPRRRVENYLRNKQILLLLDNFEHLLHLTDDVSALLAGTQRLNLLVTSRRALDLQAEQLFPITGLGYASGRESPSYQLYLHTARRRVPDYEPTREQSDDISALCARVEGLPLAIELAATWSDVHSPAQILAHLQSDLHEVWHSAADRPARQKCLWDLFDYSWQMLTPAEKDASLRLCVLLGDFTSATAAAVAQCRPFDIKRLIQASFISRSPGSRLTMHSLVRQFLTEQAVNEGYDIHTLEDNFMEVILAWAAEQSRLIRTTLGARFFRSLREEWDHVERAWWLAVARQRYALLESCWDIIFYFEARGTWDRGREFFSITRSRIPQTERRMQARLDEAQAFVAVRVYEIPRALKLAQRALDTLDDLGVDREEDEAGRYARLVLYTADYALRQSSFSAENQETLRLIASDHMEKLASLTNTLADGVRYHAARDFAGAEAAFRRALEISGPEAYTNPILHDFLGISLRSQDKIAEAHVQFNLGLKYAMKIGSLPAAVGAIYEINLITENGAAPDKPRRALDQLALEVGSKQAVGRILLSAAFQYLNLGEMQRARQATRIAVGMLWDEVDNAERARILATITQAYIAFGLVKTAPQLLALLLPRTPDSI